MSRGTLIVGHEVGTMRGWRWHVKNRVLACGLCLREVVGLVSDGTLRECECPERDGMIYHQRGACTDPVVALLDWYAPEPSIGLAAEVGW